MAHPAEWLGGVNNGSVSPVERPEAVLIGTNELIGTDPSKLSPALARLMAGQWKKGAIPPKSDGKVAERIVEHLERLLER